MPTIITLRHGRREIGTGERSGDGPLTGYGVHQVLLSAETLSHELHKRRIRTIDLAVVSGSARGTHTFDLAWGMFLRHKLRLLDYEIDKKFFSTKKEDELWEKFYVLNKSQFHKIKEELGEKEAYMSLVPDLVRPCVRRTVARIKAALKDKCKVILVVTHAPHDCLIAEHFTGKQPEKCLELGQYRILDF